MSVLSHYTEFATMAPTSWNYGCFNYNSKMQNAYKQTLIKTLMNYQLNKSRPTQAQRCSSATNRVADEEYFKAVAQENVKGKEQRDLERKQRLVETFVTCQYDEKLAAKVEKLEDFELPRNTMYLIDKVVRNKVKKEKCGDEILNNPKELIEELNRLKQIKISDLKSRIINEEKLLEQLQTPIKPKSQNRPKSAQKPVLKSGSHKPISKTEARSLSEKKNNNKKLLPAKDPCIKYSEWLKKKDLEQKLKDLLIQAEKKSIKSKTLIKQSANQSSKYPPSLPPPNLPLSISLILHAILNS